MSELKITEEDIFFGIYCICGHLLGEPEHEDGRCYMEMDNPIVFAVCPCRKPKPIPFKIEIPIYANISANSAEGKSAESR